MKVILQKNVPNLGDAGEIKEVAGGYARNFLLPRKLVIPFREGSARAALHQRRVIERKTEKRIKDMQDLAGSMSSLQSLDLKVRVGAKKKLFGSVTAMQVAQALKEKGYELDKRKIEIGEKIRALGAYKIKIRLADSIQVPLELNVIPDEVSIEAMEEEAARIEEEAAREKAAAERAAQEAGEGGEQGESESESEQSSETEAQEAVAQAETDSETAAES